MQVSWAEGEEKRVKELSATSSTTLLTSAQDELLKVCRNIKTVNLQITEKNNDNIQAHGCTCSSPNLKLSTTDAKVLKKEKATSQIGSYAFAVTIMFSMTSE